VNALCSLRNPEFNRLQKAEKGKWFVRRMLQEADGAKRKETSATIISF
jgi:hypothetical protein